LKRAAKRQRRSKLLPTRTPARSQWSKIVVIPSLLGVNIDYAVRLRGLNLTQQAGQICQ
jgi:hypothetical protein